MKNRPPRHRIERTRNKHSRAFIRENTIVIRLARNLSRTEEEDHIESLLHRMRKYAIEEREKVSIHPFRLLLEGGQTQTVTLATGKQYRFILLPGQRTCVTQRNAKTFCITISPRVRRRALHKLLWKTLSEAELPRITSLVACINQETFRARIRPVHLAFAQSQWGSCSHRGTIMINAVLLFLPPSLLRYVTIHELAHTKYHNHSRAYWEEVKRFLPNYAQVKEALHHYRLPIL
ncbi:hypothetical protein A2635_01980 [Candidatus Peribacteria bacterium RIFCSPHIGHO2_01_FULL_51_9]|nr:MAG: hypothetical protein A2635_01980 [Candidatus Peribacteria bacterium RIFCSPHIGHO2_01_FULL_51_9]